MSIAHPNIVSPVASQHVPYRRCHPLRVLTSSRLAGKGSGVRGVRAVRLAGNEGRRV
jgi:hypothetical protein